MTTHLWFAIFCGAATTLSILLLICRRQYIQHVADLRALWTRSATEARTLRMENDALHDSLRHARAALLVEEAEHRRDVAMLATDEVAAKAVEMALEARPQIRKVYDDAVSMFGTAKANAELIRSWVPRD